ncbi:MAG: hypothetical protein Q8O88_01340 [bacterium]|nr:hypothetical protein [bacterium]
MNRDFSKLRTKSKDVEIENVPLKLYGLTFPELAEFSNFTDKKDNAGGLHFLLKTSLRKAITKEEMDDAALNNFITELSSDAATKIIQIVTEVSGLGKPETNEKKSL